MSDYPHHIDLSKGLTPAVMQQYLNGEMSEKDQFHVERYLLDHPFEAEAMEGFEKHTTNFNQDLTHLTQQLDQRIGQDKKVIPIWKQPMRMAAAFALLMLSSLLIYLVLDSESKTDTIVMGQKTIEAQKKEEYTKKTTQNRPIQENIELETESLEEESKEPISNKKKAITPIAANKAPQIVEAIEEAVIIKNDLDEVVLEEMAFADKQLEERVIEEVETVPSEDIVLNEVNAPTKSIVSPQESASQIATARSSIRKKNVEMVADNSFEETIVYGKVLDDVGQPIPGATIIVKNTGYLTITDLDGNYELEILSPEDEISVAFIGYVSQSVIIGQQDSLTIQLEPDMMALEEVVVVGYGASSNSQPESYTSARPITGFIAYKRYLKNSLQYPLQAKANKVEGKVTLAVTINSLGEISDIKVLKSLNTECDQEAIRLVKEGPKWQAAKKNNNPISDEVKIKVKFEVE